MTISRSDPSGADLELPIWIQEKRRELATANLNRSYDASLGLLKWVLTSTLVLHSTALISAFGSSTFAKVLFSGPAWLFLVGAGFTIGAGLLLAISAADYAGQMSAALWNGNGLDKDKNDVFDPEPNKSTKIGALMLGLSIACFMLGTGFSALAINKQTASIAPKVVNRK